MKKSQEFPLLPKLQKVFLQEPSYQDVYKRQVLPFELVQTTYLKSEWQALHDKEERLEMAASEDVYKRQVLSIMHKN